MPNPYASGVTSSEGGWLIPISAATGAAAASSKWVYLNHNNEPKTRPISAEVFTIPSRASKVVQFTRAHNHEGSLSGFLVAHALGGSTISATGWATRLDDLYENQGTYAAIWLITPTHFFPKVFINDLSVAPVLGVDAYDFSISFIDVSG